MLARSLREFPTRRSNRGSLENDRKQTARLAPSLLAIGILLLIGGALRFAGIGYGLPYTYRVDEPTMVSIALKIFQSGDLHPHWFGYPSLMFYLNAVIYAIYFWIGRLFGVFVTPTDLAFPEIITAGVGRAPLPSLFLLSRGLTALLGTACIGLTYLIGRRIDERASVALIAAAIVAVSPAAVQSSQSVTPDTFALFFILLSFLGTFWIASDPRSRNYIFAGAAAGLAISSKYNAALIILPMVAAHFARFGWHGLTRKELYIGFGATALGFLLTTPFAILDWRGFLQSSTLGAYQYAVEGHQGQEGNAFLWYIAYLNDVEGWFGILAVLQAVYLLIIRPKSGLVLLIFPTIYFASISQLVIRNERTMMLIIPYIALLAAMFVLNLHAWALRAGIPRAWSAIGVLAGCALMLAVPARNALAADSRLGQIEVREIARRWLDVNLPPGARVAVESYSPYVDTRRFVVQGVYGMAERTSDWYLQNGFEYLVFSKVIYGSQPAKYAEFFSRFSLAMSFVENADEIRIYKTGVTLPEHRVAARFGNYGEIIELVGYDSVQQAPEGSMALKLWWRPITNSPEPLELEMRLLFEDDTEIAKMRADLFQGRGWQNQLFETAWAMPIAKNITAGSYRIQLTVVQTRFMYNLPAVNWVNEVIDPLLLGPFQIK